MNLADARRCFELLDAADALLLAGDEGVLAAHLSAVIAPLRERLAAARVAGPGPRRL